MLMVRSELPGQELSNARGLLFLPVTEPLSSTGSTTSMKLVKKCNHELSPPPDLDKIRQIIVTLYVNEDTQ